MHWSIPAGGLGVLAPHAQAPVGTQTAVVADLLQPLQVVTQAGVDGGRGQLRGGGGWEGTGEQVVSDTNKNSEDSAVRRTLKPPQRQQLADAVLPHSAPTTCKQSTHLREPAGLVVLLPVQEPVRDLVLAGVGHDGHQPLQLLSRALTCTWNSHMSGVRT